MARAWCTLMAFFRSSSDRAFSGLYSSCRTKRTALNVAKKYIYYISMKNYDLSEVAQPKLGGISLPDDMKAWACYIKFLIWRKASAFFSCLFYNKQQRNDNLLLPQTLDAHPKMNACGQIQQDSDVFVLLMTSYLEVFRETILLIKTRKGWLFI